MRTGFVVLKYIAHPRRKNPRLAIVVSKKVHKSAVGRNRIRRRLYELVRPEIAKLAVCDLVFIVVSAEVRTMPAADLREMVLKLLADAAVYKKD